MKLSRLLLFIIIAALGIWAWIALHPNPEQQIRKQLLAVARVASFAPNEGALVKLNNARRLADFFSTNVIIQLDIPGHLEHTLASREEIQQEALAARAAVQSLNVTFPDIAITLEPGASSAVADLTLLAQAAGQPDKIVQEMKITLRKTDGQWLITKVETVRTLS